MVWLVTFDHSIASNLETGKEEKNTKLTCSACFCASIARPTTTGATVFAPHSAMWPQNAMSVVVILQMVNDSAGVWELGEFHGKTCPVTWGEAIAEGIKFTVVVVVPFAFSGFNLCPWRGAQEGPGVSSCDARGQQPNSEARFSGLSTNHQLSHPLLNARRHKRPSGLRVDGQCYPEVTYRLYQ